MFSVFRIATPVTTLKVSSSSHQPNPYSPFSKRATLTVVLADATDVPVGQIKRLSLLTRPLSIYGVGNDPGDNNTANPGTCTVSTPLPTCFPVYGPFDLMYCVQNGGFGSVWAAKDQSTGRLLCLKMFRSLTDPSISRSVKMELRMFRRMVKSKGGERGKQFIMELSRSIQHDTTVLFAMELMTTDLSMYLCIEPERCKMHARQWMAQMALGVASLHEMGIIHRDIKSENILIDSRENIRIIDFGLSYLGPAGEPLHEGVGYAIDFLGTLPYIAPEVLRNKDIPPHRMRRYGTAVDWWALGCILFELESQSHSILFDAEDDAHAYVAWTRKPSQPEETYSSFQGLDPVVVNLLEGLLRVQPTARFSLSDLEKHEYFLHHDGTSEFDNAAARALDKPVRSGLLPQFRSDDGPVKVIGAAKLSSIYDWTNLKWARLADS